MHTRCSSLTSVKNDLFAANFLLFILFMSTLLEIEAAAVALPPEQREELLRFLTKNLDALDHQFLEPRIVRDGDDVLLEAPPGAPPMTAENVKRMLEDWP
jgi:hypothetical protein